MSPAQLARRNRSDLEAMFIALLVLVLAVGAFAALGVAFDDDNGSGVEASGGGGDEDVAEGPREAALALSTSDDDAEHEHAEGEAADAEGDHAEGDDHHATGGASHDDAGGTHTDDHGTNGNHDDNGNHAAGGTHDDNDDHPHGTTPAGGTSAGHNDGHGHTTTPSGGGGTTVPHDDGHGHGPPSTVGGGGGTTPTTHGHGPAPTTGPTVPGQTTTPTTHDDGHGHPDGPNVQLAELPADIQNHIVSATNWAKQYDTPAKASAAGWGKLTQFFPGIAAHYGNLSYVLDQTPVFDPTKVDMLLFGRGGANAPLVGINYILYRAGGVPPEGFAGNFDVWHRHPYLCMVGGIVVGEVPAGQQCPAGQTTLNFDGYWLLHVWSITGWESPEGIFSHYNSRVI